MSEIEVILLTFQQQIKKTLHSLVEQETQKICHNHPPVTYIVANCPYCAKFGNCFHKN
jgi:hypothetical protein